MKLILVLFAACVAACLAVAGCTTGTTPPPATTSPTAIATPLATVTAIPPVTDPQLAGTWTLGQMGTQGGRAIITVFPQPITIMFSAPGALSGWGGCNNYQSTYTLTGNSGPFGKQISIGPITSTKMACVDTGSLEATYLQILGAVSAYSIDSNNVLSMRDPSGSTLVFKKG